MSAAIPQSKEEYAFLLKLRQFSERRIRFVSFVGAGLSVESGIPATGDVLKDYLALCACKWLGWPIHEAMHGDGGLPAESNGWEPKSGAWPQLWESRPGFQFSFAAKLLSAMHAAHSAGDNSSFRRYARVLADIQDWRRALELLASADWDGEERVFRTPDNTVRDSFFHFLTHNREPGLGHRMLASLAEPLRIKTLLTTNFDDLIEQAFSKSGIPLMPFDVPIHYPLPSARVVLEQPAIVKLHGSRYALRADPSLDDYAEERDRINFLGYLAGIPLLAERGSQVRLPEELQTEVAVLVAGYSGSDRRIMHLFSEALRTMEKLHIFWICHSEEDMQRIHNFQTKWTQDSKGKTLATRFHTVKANFSLLSVNLFQYLTGTIPAAGMFYPASWHLPYPPDIPGPQDLTLTQAFDRRADQMTKSIVNCFQIATSNVTTAYSDPNTYGDIAVARQVFWRFYHGQVSDIQKAEAFWIDLDELPHPMDVFLRLLVIAGRKAGIHDPLPSFSHGLLKSSLWDWRNGVTISSEHVPQLAEEFRVALQSLGWIGNEKWVVFLNGRDSPGKQVLISRRANATDADVSPWSAASAETLRLTFEAVLSAINVESANERRINIVFVHLTAQSPKENAVQLNVPRDNNGDVVSLVKYDKSTILATCRRFANNNTDNCFLLYTLSSFELVRYPSAILRVLTDCHDRGWHFFKNSRTAEEWLDLHLNYLQSEQVIRTKASGHIWMSYSVRQELRILAKAHLSLDQCHTVHRLIARWYGRLFIASADPLAALGVMNQALAATQLLAEADTHTKSSLPVDPNAHERLLQNAASALNHAGVVLQTAQPELLRKLACGLATPYLEQFRDWIAELLKVCSLEGSRLSSLRPFLVKLNRKLAATSLATWELESDLERVTTTIQIDDLPPATREAPTVPIGKLADVHSASILIRKRYYKRAANLLIQLLPDTARFDESASILDSHASGWPDVPGEWISRVVGDIRRWLFGSSGVDTSIGEEPLKLCIRVHRRLTYLRMHEAQALLLHDSRMQPAGEPAPTVNARSKFLAARAYCERGLEMLRAYDGADLQFVYHENARFRAHYALILARIASLRTADIARMVLEFTQDRGRLDAELITRRSQTYRRAEQVLCDSEAFALEFPLKDDYLSRCITYLRKAEIALLRIRDWPGFRLVHDEIKESANRNLADADFHDRMRHCIANWHVLVEQRTSDISDDALPTVEHIWEQKLGRSAPKELQTTSMNEAVSDSIEQYLRLSQDVWDCLERAEELLRMEMKNTWWKQVSHVLRFLAAECFCVISTFCIRRLVLRVTPSSIARSRPDVPASSVDESGIPSWAGITFRKVRAFLAASVLQPPRFFEHEDPLFFSREIEVVLNLRIIGRAEEVVFFPSGIHERWERKRALLAKLSERSDATHISDELKLYADSVLGRWSSQSPPN